MATILGKREWEYFIKECLLIPSDGGRFEFEVDGQVLFSKKSQGRHAQEGEIEKLFDSLVRQYMAEHNIFLPDFD
jgi:predicted Rdx family selenoprotein